MKKAALICLFLIMTACGKKTTPAQTDGNTDLIETPVITPSPIIISDLPRLQIVGNKIVNEDGEVVILRGLGTQQIINLATTDFDTPWNEDLFRTIHEWGATVVRVLVAPVLFFENEERGLEVLDQAVEWAGKYDLYVIIDFQAMGFPPTGFSSYPSSNVEVTTAADTIRFWQDISARYAGNDHIAFYEIINEASSHPWNGSTYLEDWLTLKDFSELLIDLIRENDPDTIVLVSGLKWASDLSYVLDHPIQRSNVAYAMHLYPNTALNWDLAFGDTAKVYPVILSDTGFGIDIDGESNWLNEKDYPGDQPYRTAFMNYVNEHGLSWIAVSFSSSWYPQLIDNTSFEPSEVGAFFREQLLSYEWKTTTGELINDEQMVFTRVIGQWNSIDPTYGGTRSLSIAPISDDIYSISYENSAVPLCGVNTQGIPLTGASAEGTGKAFYQKLDVGPIYFDCNDGLSTGGLLYDTFLYDEELDILTDLIGTVWSRTE